MALTSALYHLAPVSADQRCHSRTERQVGCQHRGGKVPSEVHAEQSDTQTLHHRTHQKSDTDGDSVGNRPPGRQLESSEGEAHPETGAIPEVIGKPGKNGRRRWTQSKAIEQQYAHEFRKVAGHEAQSKSGVAYHFEGDRSEERRVGKECRS